MITNATLTAILLTSWFGPFGDDDVSDKDAVTIESLENKVVEVPEMGDIQVDSRAALAQYKLYLELAEGDPAMRLEAMRRLGDLSLQAGEDESISDSEYGKTMVLHQDAVRLYEQLLASYENYAEADLVLYQLARAYESAGEPEKALTTLDRLVADFPSSNYLDEAEFRRGEILFVKKDYLASGQAYQRVIDFGSASKFYQQSLYKNGWANFKRAEYGIGANSFLDLLNLRFIDAGSPNPAADENLQARIDLMSRADRELVDDTVRVLSLAFSYLDGAESIGVYLDQRDQIDSAFILYTSLGALYLEKERYMDAAQTFNGFVQREPFSRNAPLLSAQAIDAYRTGNFPSLVLEGKQSFVEAYGLQSDYWSFHAPSERPEVIAALKTNLSDLAQYDHALAQESGDVAAYGRAAGWYRRYLEYFPDDPDSSQRSFLLGEILMESGSFEEANTFYLGAAYNYPGYERASESGYAALLASRAHYATLSGEQKAAWHEQQNRQALEFAQSFSTHNQAGPVLVDAAESYYAANQLDEAVLIAGEVLKLQPAVDENLRSIAWTVVAHGQFDMEHFPRAEQAYIELRSMGAAGGIDAVEVDERIAASVYRQAEAAQTAGDVDAAVTNFLRVASVAPTATIGVNSTYDAAALLISESRWIESIQVLKQFRRDFPNHEFSDDVTRKLAVAYTEAGQSLRAAAEFERIAEMSSADDVTHREALWTAAELYGKTDRTGDARRVWATFVERFPEPVVESIEARQYLADLAGNAGDAGDRKTWLASIVSADSTAGRQRNDRTKTLAAVAALELADPKRDAFNAVRLNIPLAKSLETKKLLMESALSAYNKAAGYGVADVTTVATFRIAELYSQLSADLMESERPNGLSADELEQYEILLEEQAFPFEEKAIQLYEVNASRSVVGVYDEWVASSFAKLAVLMPARYAKFEKAENYVAELY